MSADSHLLFGLLALQNEFIDKRQLVAAFGIWMTDPSVALHEILVQQRSLVEKDREILLRLVERHIAARNGDVAATLFALSVAEPVCRELGLMANHTVQESIAKLRPAAHDGWPCRSFDRDRR